MPFEMFLSRLKQICMASNWKTVPFTVAFTWASRRAFLFRRSSHSISSVLEVETVPSSELLTGAALQSTTSSILASLFQKQMVVASARFLSLVVRDTVAVSVGEWLLISGEHKRVACVREMMAVCLNGCMHIRLWCHRCCVPEAEETPDGFVRAPRPEGNRQMLVSLESVSIILLACRSVGSVYEFQYLL